MRVFSIRIGNLFMPRFKSSPGTAQDRSVRTGIDTPVSLVEQGPGAIGHRDFNEVMITFTGLTVAIVLLANVADFDDLAGELSACQQVNSDPGRLEWHYILLDTLARISS